MRRTGRSVPSPEMYLGDTGILAFVKYSSSGDGELSGMLPYYRLVVEGLPLVEGIVCLYKALSELHHLIS